MDELSNQEAVSLLQQRQMILVEMKNRAERAPQHTGAMQYVVDHQIIMLQAESSWLDSVIQKRQTQ